MLFEQNIASNVTRNQKYKHLTNLNIAKERPSTPKHLEQLLAPYRNFLNLKKQEFFDFHEMSEGGERKKKEEESSLQIRLKQLRRIKVYNFSSTAA